jgi:hypothetical protein
MTSNTEIEIISQPKNADKIIDALKELIKSALCQGFNKTSYLVRDHIKYIKKIQFANDPESHVIYTAKKLFPNEETYYEKIEKVHTKYEGELLAKFEKIYELYYELSKSTPQKRKITSIEADSILADLLI